MKRITSLLLLAALLILSFTSCGILTPNNDNDDTDNQNAKGVSFADANVTNISDPSLAIKVYDIKSNSSSEKLITSFTDNIYNYFYFKLGEIENVPIYYSNLWTFNGVGEATLPLENSETIEKTVERSISTCISKTVSETKSKEYEINPTLGVGEGVAVSSIASKGFKQEKTSSYELSTSKEYTNSLTNSITNSTVRALKLTKNDPKGDYRFIIYADIEVYCVVIAEPETEKISFEYLTTVKHGTQREGWFYGNTGEVDIERNIETEAEKLTLSEEALGQLDLFEKTDKKLFLRRLVHPWGEFRVDWGKVQLIGPPVSSLMNEETISALGITKAIITLQYSTQTPSGECTACVDTYISYYERNGATLIAEEKNKANGNLQRHTKNYEVSIEEFMSSDGHLGIEFYPESDGFLDILKNNCIFKEVCVTIELKR